MIREKVQDLFTKWLLGRNSLMVGCCWWHVTDKEA